MIWQYTPYTIPLMIVSAFSIFLGIYIWFHRRSPLGKIGSVIVLANSEWIVTHALELASADLSTKIFWDKMQFLGIVTVPTGWFIYALYYTGGEKWLTRRTMLLLILVPFITVVLAFTSGRHDLIWTSYTLDKTGPFTVLYNTYGPWLWVFIGYVYLLGLFAASLLIQMFIHSHSFFRWQISALMVGALAPWIASALVAFNMNPFPHLEITPVFFTVTNVVVAFSRSYLQLGDIVPMARETIIECLGDSIIVLDAENRIVDMNPSAHSLLGGNTSQIIGKPVEEVWSEFHSQMKPGKSGTCKEIVLDCMDRPHIYDVRTFPLDVWKDCTVGWIVVLRDITDRKRAEERIEASLQEKEVLLREIHHRVRNNMQVISSLLSLQSQHVEDKTYTELLRESQDRIKSMALIHEKLYQSENLAKIGFGEYVGSLVHSLIRSYRVNTEKIAVKMEIEGVFLDIDTAIPCGLISNELVSNSLRHAFPGGREGEIVVRLCSSNGTIELTVTDNGVGMPENVDFRKTQSLGLHLVTILVENQLGGTISLNRSRRTTFHITFGGKRGVDT